MHLSAPMNFLANAPSSSTNDIKDRDICRNWSEKEMAREILVDRDGHSIKPTEMISANLHPPVDLSPLKERMLLSPTYNEIFIELSLSLSPWRIWRGGACSLNRSSRCREERLRTLRPPRGPIVRNFLIPGRRLFLKSPSPVASSPFSRKRLLWSLNQFSRSRFSPITALRQNKFNVRVLREGSFPCQCRHQRGL